MGKDNLLYKANKKIAKPFFLGKKFLKIRHRYIRTKIQYELHIVSHCDCIKAPVTIYEGSHICKLVKAIN